MRCHFSGSLPEAWVPASRAGRCLMDLTTEPPETTVVSLRSRSTWAPTFVSHSHPPSAFLCQVSWATWAEISGDHWRGTMKTTGQTCKKTYGDRSQKSYYLGDGPGGYWLEKAWGNFLGVFEILHFFIWLMVARHTHIQNHHQAVYFDLCDLLSTIIPP